LRTKVETYLRDTNKEELNPEGIKRDLQLLLKDPGAGLGSLGDRLGQFDRSTFVVLLSLKPKKLQPVRLGGCLEQL
jgi:hypothetical protein